MPPPVLPLTVQAVRLTLPPLLSIPPRSKAELFEIVEPVSVTGPPRLSMPPPCP